MKFRSKFIYITLTLTVATALVGCTFQSSRPIELEEDRSVYLDDSKDTVKHLYVTVMNTPKFPNTFSEINQVTTTEENPQVEIILQEGDIEGPQSGKFGYEVTVPNASIQVRGQNARVFPQKSYKIKLYDNSGKWMGQDTLNLNKHGTDPTRVRNKLSFDYFKTIANFSSMRTQFIHLHVKDLTKTEPDQQFVDYGLFTHIEQPNKSFLQAHGLDPTGHLYKISFFEFFRYPEDIKLATDKDYNKANFERLLDIKGSEDHSKLIRMLDDLNNYELDINEVVNKHFNRDNYLTWVAVNILVGNLDTTTRNFMLYSPSYSQIWYFLPWDYDKAWGHYEFKDRKAPWQAGIGNYWGTVLAKRFFKDQKNVEALTEKIEELSQIFTLEQTSKMLIEYYPIVSPYAERSPDLDELPIAIEEHESYFRKIAEIPRMNKENYYATLERPMPIFLGVPQVTDEQMHFTWDASFDFQRDPLSYHFQISSTPDFSTILFEEEKVDVTSITVNKLPPGEYYWRVIVRDQKENEQVAFDVYVDDQNLYYFGIKSIIVE